MLNVEALLQDIGIHYKTSGANISSGWIGCACPFCGDTSYHCGIAPSGYTFSCWRCGKKGSIKKLVTEYKSGNWREANAFFDKHNSALFVKEHIQQYDTVSKVEWPEHCTKKLPTLHRNYLKNRGYDPDHIQELYDVRAVHQLGDWKYRLIIPMYMQGTLVSFVGRDVSGESDLRYKNLQKEKSIIPVKNTVFNIDAIHETAIICEGVTDAWRFGSHAVATLGLQLTAMQMRVLSERLKRAIICFDNESIANQKAMMLGESLAFQGIDVDIVQIDESDPGSMSQRKANKLIKRLNL